MNRGEVKKLLALLQAHAPQERVTDATTAVWEMAMDDVPYEAVLPAVRTWIRASKWFPKPVELRDLVLDHVCGLPTADDAWTAIEREIAASYPGRTHDGWSNVPELAMKALRQIGGTWAVRHSERREVLRDRFIAVYNDRRREALKDLDVAERWAALHAGPTVRVLPEREAS